MVPAPASKYYTELQPFREWFRQGVPILTYHKLGPRPRGTRIKGLYASKQLFERQLREFVREGFKSIALNDATTAPAKSTVGITFDDGFENVWRHGIPLLTRYRFSAIQFLVADLIGRTNEWEQPQGEAPAKLMDQGQVREWLENGHEIGAHSLTHPFLTRIPFERAREEVFASKRRLEDMFQTPIRHFCYPYGDRNPAIRDLVQQAGYETACSVEFGINTPETDRFALKRITVRYATRSLRGWFRRVSLGLRGKR